MAKFVFLSDENRKRYLRIVEPIGNVLARWGIHPHVLSITGLILSVVAGLLYSTGSFFWAAWIVVLAGTCDVLDGQLARQTKNDTSFGAFFDSTIDRFSEMFFFLGLAWHYSVGGLIEKGVSDGLGAFHSPSAIFLIILTLAGSFMVSYSRARGEGLGVKCTIGWMQRPERMTLLIVGSLLASIPLIGQYVMMLTLLLLAVLSNYTVFQRITYIRNALAKETGSQ